MTVLRANISDEHALPRRRNAFFGPRGSFSVPVSPQTQSWTKSLEINAGKRRSVIAEKKTPMRPFSSEGIRWDVLVVLLALALLLFICILVSDVSALCSGGYRIGRLSDGIASLEESNSALREKLYWTRDRWVLPWAAESSADAERTVILSLAPLP